MNNISNYHTNFQLCSETVFITEQIIDTVGMEKIRGTEEDY